MDDPRLDAAEHRQALRGLRRLNAASLVAQSIWGPLSRLARTRGLVTARVLDLATGGGEVAVDIARRAARAGWRWTIVATDISDVALEMAAGRAERSGVALEAVRLDAICDRWPDDVDIIICTLFLHHLQDQEVLAVLGRMADSARHGVFVTDLKRSRTGLTLAHVAARLLSRSAVVHHDAPQSVRAALTMRELRGLAERAGMTDANLSSVWPQRQRLVWVRT